MIPSTRRPAMNARAFLILSLLMPVLLIACTDNKGGRKTGFGSGIVGTTVTGTFSLTINIIPNNVNKGASAGVTVVVQSLTGAPIPGRSVQMATNGGTVAPPAGQTDNAGKFVTQISIPDDYNGPNPIDLSATVDGLTVVAKVNINDLGTLLIDPAGPLTLAPGDKQFLNCVGGVPPYRWEISGGSVNVSSGPQVIFTAGSQVGTFFVTCADSGGHSASVQIVIDLGAGKLDVTPRSVTMAPGQTQIFQAIGGRPGYTWSFAAGAGTLSSTTGQQITLTAGNTSGTFSLILTDSSGATVPATVEVKVPTLDLKPDTVTRQFGTSCNAANCVPPPCTPGTVAITFTVTGGVPPYKASATAGTATVSGNLVTYSITIPSLAASSNQTESITVLDNVGQSDTSTVTISCIKGT